MQYQQFTGDINKLRNDPVFFFNTLLENNKSILLLPHTNLFSLFKNCQFTLVGCEPRFLESVFKNPHLFGNFVPEEGLEVAKKSEEYRKLTSSFTTSQSEDYHRKIKTLIQPAFSTKSSENSEPALLSCLNYFAEELKVGENIEINATFQRLGLYIANRLIFGIKDFQNNLALGQLFHHTRVLRLKIIGGKDLNEKEKLEKDFIETAKLTYETIYQQIDRFRENESRYDGVYPTLCNLKDTNGDYLLTRDELINQSNSLFSTTYHPFTSIMTWSILLVSTFPAVYHKLQDEISNVTVDYANVEKLTYLDYFIKEVMRMLPANAIMVRKGLQPISLFGMDFPQNIEVVMSPLVTHRNPDIFSSPEHFMPERWEHFNPQVFEYLPFGVGNRYCTGAHLAMVMMKLTLATLLKEFQFKLRSENVIDWTVNTTLLPVRDIVFQLFDKNKKLTQPNVQGNINKLICFP